MTLNKNQLAAQINGALRKADVESAPQNLKEVKGRQTKQRVAMAKAIADVVIQHILDNAEVVTPDHDPFRTEVIPGPGPHAHPITVPLKHKRGKII